MQILIKTWCSLSLKPDSIYGKMFRRLFWTPSVRDYMANGVGSTIAKTHSQHQKSVQKTKFMRYECAICIGRRQPASHCPYSGDSTSDAKRLMWHQIASKTIGWMDFPMEIRDRYAPTASTLHTQDRQGDRIKLQNSVASMHLHVRYYSLAADMGNGRKRHRVGHRTKANTQCLHFMALILAFLYETFMTKNYSRCLHIKKWNNILFFRFV